MNDSNKFTLNKKDFLNGLLLAVLSPVLVLIQQTVDAGQLTFDWKALAMAAVAGASAYLMKKFFQGPTTPAAK